MRNIVLAAFIAFIGLSGSGTAEAETLPAPKQRPILTVSGNISVTNQGNTAVFDRAMLEAVGTVSFETETPWYSERVKFEGVPLSKLMQHLGAKGEHIVVTALNDYSSDIPFTDITKYNVILATKQNGQYMSVRDKGPLFVVYPFDSDPELKHQTYYGRSVWQVSKITVK
ncbi:molybdopterin-dependent oxidoreductase [Microvirga sp. ACRRW]|uniref:molybdopterin-dependent oxidoreductase n=1 Tax=Microvirga sp. ACRRW TaxID=2918205 RepID=UPI001EF43402|nr:molybdopterin-dependent oxidoreductase [Microvirga sp. ACRRW]MCG7392981.1 molybdopterin-dependent oxidoreductase [Microvirga sp. ACRRW]